MAKKTKKSKPFSIRMEKSTFDRLEDFCNKAGQSKTLAVERAINAYIDDYNEKQKKIIKQNNEI